jgi:hypothetical protein
MGLYGVAEYGDRDGIPYETDLAEIGDVYGDSPQLAFSGDPFRAVAISYTQISLTWVSPAGDYSELRIVRSFDGYPETAEDGAIVYSWNNNDDDVLETAFIDGDDPSIGLTSGKFVYYRMWLKRLDNRWKIASDAYTLLPIRHSTLAPDGTELVNTKNKVLDILPRVFTTATQSPIDEVNPNSDLAKFLDGPSFELDRILTYAGLLLPLETNRYVSPEILLLQSTQLGLPIEPFLATKQQRRLAREALYIYQNKGTENSIEAFVESFTGFAPEVTKSPNIILTTQDSSFTGGLGFWKPVGNLTLELETTVPGVSPEIEPYVDDYRFVAKITANEVGSRIISGTDDPVRHGTPVNPGTAHIFSGYGKSLTGTTEVTGHALWYDLEGRLIDIDPPRTFIQTPQVVEDDWTRFQLIGRSPGVEQRISTISIDDGVLTFYLLEPNIMVRGETIIVSEVSPEIDGVYQIESIGSSLDDTFNQVRVLTDLSDKELTPVSGQLSEGIPLTNPTAAELSVQVPAGTLDPKWVVIAGEIVDGIATVTFADDHDLTEGDLLVLQAMSTYFSFGVHTILSVPETDQVTFQIYEPYTGVINTTLDQSFAVTGVPYGFGFQVVPGTAAKAPKAYYAGFELVMQTENTLYLDLLQMATFDVQEFHEARAVEIFLYPTKSNYLLNPGFNPAGMTRTIGGVEVPIWDISAATYDNVDRTDVGLVGAGFALELEPSPSPIMVSYSVTSNVATIVTAAPHVLTVGDIFSIVGTGTALDNVPFTATAVGSTSISFAFPSPANVASTSLSGAIAPVILSTVSDVIVSGKFITSSVSIKTDTSTPEALLMSALAYDGQLEEIVQTISKPILVTDEWQRFDITLFVPAEVSEPASIVINLAFSGVMSGQTLYFDQAMVENSFKPTDYFDGDSGPSYGAVWGNFATLIDPNAPYREAEPYQSPSHLYPNLDTKVIRLQQELEKYIPLNSSFLIRWYGGGVAKPLL